MPLEREVEALRKEINTERMSMSIGELASLYQRGELDIHPQFQRFLRWTDAQKTKLVESLLLRIPIPPLFVAQDPNGRWDVVDGVQRLGTIFQFLGILCNRDGEVQSPLVLLPTKLLPKLEGFVFTEGHTQSHFTQAQQLDFKRLRLDLQIILKESDPTTKYELFERLNTGGSIASDQEVRNCVLVWMNEPLFDWMLDALAENDDFVEGVILTDRLEDRQYRLELVLRFLALYQIKQSNLKGLRDLGEFLNEQNRAIGSDPKFNRKEHERVFTKTFKIINAAAGSNAFRKYDSNRELFRGGFLISAFEALALGVAYNIGQWDGPVSPEKKLENLIKKLWAEEGFTGHIGMGVPARERIQHSIPFGRKFFRL